MVKSVLVAGIVALAAQLAAGHYTFPSLIVNGAASTDWQYVRTTANHYSNGPVTSLSDPALRCYELDSTQASLTKIATVAAGSSVGFKANQPVFHNGYFSAYLSPASPGADSTSAGTGATWFKIWDWGPTVSGNQLVWPSLNAQQVTFTIPKSVPSGQYLLRVEHVALHIQNSPQFYISCAQLSITGGGSGNPPEKVAIPGVYKGNEPGLFFNPYSIPSGYTYPAPGPAVWQG